MAVKARNQHHLVVNNPSDMPRKVGVISTAPNLSGHIIIRKTERICQSPFTIRGYDMYFNPVKVDPASVKWSVSGIKEF